MALFGNPQASAFGGASSGGLFGGGQQQQQTKSLFGGAPGQTTSAFGAQPQSTGGIFGGASAGTTSSLFGGGQSQPAAGGLFGQQQPQQQSQGLFGAQPQTNTFGQQPQGAQPGGLFGGTQQQAQPGGAFSQGLQGNGAQGGGGLFGGLQGAQPQQSTSAFGGGFQSIAQGSTSAFTSQQPGGTSVFGSSTSAFGAGGSGGTGLFQGAQQTQPAAGGLFGQQPQATGGFMQPQQQQQKSSFFNNAQTQQTSSFGVFGGAQSQGLGGGGLFGNASATQPQQQTAFGQSQSAFGQTLGGGFGQPAQQQMGMGANAGQQGFIYGQPHLYMQQVSTIGYQFRPTMEMVQDKVKDPVPNLAIQNLRGDQRFKFCSNEMLRVLDMLAQKGQQVQSYEFSAMNEFSKNQAQYPPNLMQMIQQRTSPAGGQNAFSQQQNNAFQQSSAASFGQQSQFGQNLGQPQQQPASGLFGQPAAQPQASQGGSLFGNPAQSQPAAGGLFGQPQPQQQVNNSLQRGLTFGGQNQQQPQQSSGLFGAAPQQSSLFQQQQPGGLFGAQSQTPKPAGSGLFGAPSAQSTASSSSGLFGAPQAQPGATGGLFGQPQQKTAQTSLFGNPAQPAQQPGSLFGGSSQPQQPGGLFGGAPAQQPQGSSLFGNIGQTQQQPGGLFGSAGQQTGGGLFGSQPKPVQQPGSLFGAPAQQPQGGGLFGTPQPQGGGLFGTPQPQQQPGQTSSFFNFSGQTPGQTTPGQPQVTAQAAFNPMLAYQSQDPFGMSEGFMSHAAESADAVKKELEAISYNAEKAQQAFESKHKPLESFSTTPGYGMTPGELQQCSDLQLGISLSLQPEYTGQQRDDEYRVKQEAKYGASSQRYKNELKEMKKQHEQQYGQRKSHFGYRDLTKRHTSNMYSTVNENESMYRSMSALTQIEESFEERRLRQPKVEGVDISRIPNLSRNFLRVSSSFTENKSVSSSSQLQAKQYPDTVQITVILNVDGYDKQELPIRIHKSRDTSDLFYTVQRWLESEFGLNAANGDNQFSLLFRNQFVDKKVSLKDAGITDDTAKIFIQVNDQDPASETKKDDKTELLNDNKKDPEVIESASDDLKPKEPKQGYQTSPEFKSLLSLSLAALKRVEDFTVSNQHGSIQWLGETDLTGVDLADIISIDDGFVEVYQDDGKHKNSKPPVGQKLNRPAIITLMNKKPKKNQSVEAREQQLMRSIERAGGQHLSYDPKNNCAWSFKVNHFTKWGDDDSDEEEEDEGGNIVDRTITANKQPANNELSADSKEESKSAFKKVVPKKKQFTPTDGINVPFEKSLPRGKFGVPDSKQPEVSVDQEMEPEIAFSQQPYPFNQSISVASSQYGKFAGKRQHREAADSEKDLSAIIESSGLMRGRDCDMKLFTTQAQQREKAQRVEMAIRRKEALFKEVNPLNGDRPSDGETMKFLQQLGIKPAYAKTSFRSGIARPCFSPNGQIAFVSNNKIRIVPTAPVDPSDKPAYSPASTILNYTQIESNNDERHKLGDKLANMNLSQENADGNEGNALVNLDQDKQFAQKMLFNDSFFFKLLRKELPQVSFCQTGGIGSQQVQLNGFLYDLAREMSEQTQSEKLTHEFIVVCMLNALFGNPNLNLVQLHPLYRGPNTIKRDWALFGKFDPSKASSAVEMEKKRLNAVAEVLRFHCPLVHRDQQSHNVYSDALQRLRNGDIKQAVRLLGSHGKNKLALVLARSLNSRQAMDQFQQHIKNFIGKNAPAELISLCRHISCSNNTNEAQQLNLPWDQELLRSVLFARGAQDNLKGIIRSRAALPNFCNIPSMLWSVLAIYANIRDSDVKFKNFNLDLAPGCSQRDYRLRWLVQLIVTKSLHLTESDPSESQGGSFAKKSVIESTYFVKTAGQYIRQLLAVKDWRSALTVAMLIPACFPAIRAKISYETLGYQVASLVSSKRSEHEFITQKLHLPQEWLTTTLALCLQNFNLNEAAIEAWKKAGNPQQAHRIFHEKILPLYMNSSANVSLVKALQFSSELMPAERAKLIQDQLICQRGAAVDKIVSEFHEKSAVIPDWDSRTGNFRKFCLLLKNLQEKGASSGEACRSYTSIIRSIQQFSRDEPDDPVDHFIGQEIATIANLLQIREDDENARVARESYAGVSYRPSHSQTQYKLASDAQFVAQNRPRIERQAEQLVVSQLLNQISSA